MKRIGRGLLCAVASSACSLWAGTGAWNVDGDGAWTNSANWVNGTVAGGTDSTAYFTNALTFRRTVTVDTPVSVGAMRFSTPSPNNNWRFIGNGSLFLDGVSAKPRLGSTVNNCVEIYTPLTGTNGFYQEALAGDIELAGDNSGLQGLGTLTAYTVRQTLSKTATNTLSGVRNYFPVSGVLMSGARFELLGRKNGSAVASSWALTAGSAQVSAWATNATSLLAPGQIVSGTGVADGAFIRMIIDGSNLVLSAAATQTATSTLAFAAASFYSEQLLQRVRVDGAQTFKMYKNGGNAFTVTVERVYGNNNFAVKEGDATLVIPGQRELRGSLQYQCGDLVLAPRTATRRPAPGASFHVDASQADTLTLGSNNKVGEWFDTSTNGISAKMPTTTTNDWPTLLPNALNGKPVVDFGAWGTGKPYMFWYRAGSQLVLSNIYAVFWVLGSQNGGGFLLGSGLANSAHFHRGTDPTGSFNPSLISSRIWGYDWGTYPGAGRMTTFIDGIPVDANAALSGGYQLISCQITTNCTAGAFARDRTVFADRCGGQRLAEVILYERPLSEQERIETEEYLTAKWFGDTRWDADGQDPYVTDLNALGTRSLYTPDTGTNTVGHLSGAGKLTKTGNSTFALTDAQDYLGSLVLSGGGLSLSAAAVPSSPATNAYFHVDASLTNTFVFDANGRISEWRDWRGNGLKATVPGNFVGPTLLTSLSGGKTVVDFGAQGSQQILAWNQTNSSVTAAFVVFQSLGNLSPILGSMTNTTDFYRGAGGQLFNSDGASSSRAVVYGANYVNGWRVEPMVSTLPSSLCVVSSIPTTPARASAFAYSVVGGYSGGQRLAEAIVYTRTLTDQERRDTEAYLMRKWLNRAAPGYGDGGAAQIPALSYSGSNLNVSVTGSGVATIGQLTGGGTVVKTGGGTLALGNGQTALAGAIQVAEGTVTASASSDAAPALLPLFHVDASRTNTLTISQVNGTNFITRWASIGAVSNAAVTRSGYNLPYILTNDLAGLPTIGFGAYGTNNCACLKWETSVSTVRSAFLVLGSQEGGGFILGAAGSANFHRGGYNNVLNPVTIKNTMFGWDVSSYVTGGSIYLDGTLVASPLSQLLSGGYQVIELLTTDNTTADLLAADRTYADRVGGQRLAEVIVYDRALTESERKQTEAYLFKKWFGRSAQGAGLGTVRVTDGTSLSAVSSAVSVNRLEGFGSVVKSGSNTLTLVDVSAFTGVVDVASGTLNLAQPAAPLSPPTNTLFWVDACKAGSMDTDASGNVLTWRDATGNGLMATSLSGRTPTLRGNDFVGRPVVDFGAYGQSASAGMLWSQRVSGIKTAVWLLGSQLSGGYLLGATNNGTSFHRGPPPEGGEIAVTNFTYRNYILSANWGANIPTAAYTNGVSVTTTTTGLSGGYQSLFMTWTSATYADGFAFDRLIGDRFGGQRLGEFIAYDRVLTDAERLATDAYLNWKWFGLTTPGYARAATQLGVVLRTGTALTMNGTEQTVSAVSGAGAVSNGTLVVTGLLSPGFAQGDCASLSVNGGLTLADGASYAVDVLRTNSDVVAVSGALTIQGTGTVTVRLPDPPGAGWAGRVAVATFGSLSGASHLSSWTVTGLPSAYTGGLVADSTTVYLEIRAKGLLIQVR